MVDAVIPATGELVEIAPGLGGALPGRVLSIGLDLPPGLSFERWAAIGETLRGIEGGVLWWIGDWLRYGEREYGEKYTQALDATNYSYQTVRDAKWVAGQFELSRRRDSLSWSYHREVAAIKLVETQDGLLDCAANQGWSRTELRAAAHQAKNRVDADHERDTRKTKKARKARADPKERENWHTAFWLRVDQAKVMTELSVPAKYITPDMAPAARAVARAWETWAQILEESCHAESQADEAA